MSAREVAFLVVRDVFGEPPRGAQAAFEFRLRRSGLDARDRAFAAELAYGSIKARRLLDWYLKPFLGDRLATLPFSIAEILRMGIYQLRVMNGVEAHAAVHETVGLALRFGHKGTAGLVNAVLRRFERETPPPPQADAFGSPADYLGTRYSMPSWVVTKYLERFGEERLEAILDGLDGRPQVAVTVDRSKASVDAVRLELAERGFPSAPSPFVSDTLVLDGSAAGIDAPADQRYFLQSESAAMSVELLDPKPHERVVEFCAGRGNKTLQLAARLANDAQLETIELEERKAEQLKARLASAGRTQVKLLVADALQVKGDPADAVLVDAPCSGLGVLGRYPEARWRKQPDDSERLAQTQFELLSAAVGRLKPGGRVVYGVCSTDPREGDAIVDRLLAESAAVAPLPLPDRFASFAMPGRPGQALIPPGIDGRDGFFLALLGVKP